MALKAKRIGWVVDVQRDFVEPDGRLYVKDLDDPHDPGAVQAIDRIREAVRWMREHCVLVVYTGDWHDYGDPEIDPENPDPASGTYPPHCMGRSDDPEERRGAEIVEGVAPEDPLLLEVDATAGEARGTATEAARTGRPVFIHKTRFDVFEGNDATTPFVDALVEELGGDPEFVVVGVARDVCVTAAVDGLAERGYAVTALRDATWGLGLEPEPETLARWAGEARVATLDEIRRS